MPLSLLFARWLPRRPTACACGVAAWLALSGGAPGLAHAAASSSEGRSGGPFGMDRFDEREDTGWLSRANQKRLDWLVIAGTVSTAAWEGTDSRLGRTAWQTFDAIALSSVATSAMKVTFQRARPIQSDNPNDFFAGPGHYSFPSGETALIASAVTPALLTYGAEQPALWALAALPVYMGAARMASQGHWLSDVLVGAAVGVGTGWYAVRHRDSPLLLGLTRDGVFVGWKQRF